MQGRKGKVRKVTKTTGSPIEFRYDASGNRVEKKQGTSITRYIRDASGNVMAVYQADTVSERPIYGSSRLGNLTYASKPGYRTVGHKQYELSNHLGNVLAVVSDRIHMSTESTWAEVLSRTDYYPFGLEMTGRTESNGYRYGFQGQEKINEIYGEGNYIDYTYRGYNTRIGRFFAVDPLAGQYPYYTPYQFSGNRVIDMVELEGLEPAQSGSYGGQGAIAPKLDDKGNAIGGTENQRWTWNKSQWSATHIGVTNSELTKLFPKGKADILQGLESALNLEGAFYGIDSYEEMAGFIGQAAHESGGFRTLSENLNYSLKGLKSTFSAKRLNYLSDEDLTSTLNSNLKLSQLLYGGVGNLDYRGRGLIQTTWKTNYNALSNSYNSLYGTKYDFTKTPALLSTDKQIAVRSGLIFFRQHGLFSQSKYDNGYTSKKINRWDSKSFGLRDALYNFVLKEVEK